MSSEARFTISVSALGAFRRDKSVSALGAFRRDKSVSALRVFRLRLAIANYGRDKEAQRTQRKQRAEEWRENGAGS